MSKGFTLVELLVVIGIIALFSALFLPNYSKGAKQLALARSAHKLAQDLRRAQEMSVSAKEFNGVSSRGGYGLAFIKSWSPVYRLFADLNDDKMRSGNEDVEILTLEKGVQFDKIYADGQEYDFTTLTFIPPDPQVCLHFCRANNLLKIIISLESNPASTKTISINNAGLIEVGN